MPPLYDSANISLERLDLLGERTLKQLAFSNSECPEMADLRLPHCDIVVQCSESAQKVPNGQIGPLGDVRNVDFDCR